jgi:diguanylate cyclase (GGDEF)-like protein/PAS domain S-box-containing protein
MSASFSSRIMAYFGALFLAAMGGVFSLWYFGLPLAGLTGAGSQRLQEATRLIELTADHKHAALLSGIKERRGDILIISENKLIPPLLSRGDPAVQQDFERIVSRLHRAYPDRYQHLLIVDPVSKQIRASSMSSELGQTFSDPALIERAAKPGNVELIEQFVRQKGHAIAIVRQIHATSNDGYASGQTVGVLIAILDVTILLNENWQSEPFQTNASGISQLFDANKQLIATSANLTPGSEPFELNPQVAEGFDGTLQERDSQGTERIVVYRNLQLSSTRGWTLAHSLKKQDALAGLQGNVNTLALAGLLLTLLALGLISVAARRITLPLRTLASTARQFGAGELSIRAMPQTQASREIEALSDAFNVMAQSIQKDHQTLEARVQERTAELHRSQAQQRTFFESTADAVLLLDQNRIIDCNAAAIRLFGAQQRDDLLTRQPGELSPPQQSDGSDSQWTANKHLGHAMRQGQLTIEWRHQRLDTEETFLAEVLFNRVDVNGQVIMQMTVRDITARKQAEQQLRLSEENLTITLQSIGDAVIATDAAGLITRMNATAERLTGWSLADANGRPLPEVFQIINAQTRETSVNPVQRVMERGEIVELSNHTALLARDGQEFQIADSAAPIRDAAGQIVGVVLVFSDVTAQYQAQAALEKSESQNRALISAIPDLIFTNRRDGTYLSVQTSDPSLLFAQPESFLQQNIATVLPPFIAEQFMHAFIRALDSQTMQEITYALPIRGQAMHFEARIMPTVQDTVITIVRDITEQKRTEEALRIAATAFESQEGITITNAEQVILRVNQAFTEITGYSADEAVGHTPRLLKSGRHDAAFFAQMWQAIAQQGSWQGEIWNRRKCGEVFPEWLTITAVKNENAVVTHYVATFTDISAHKEAENQIKHLAFYDPLTGLPNRRLLMDRLAQALSSGARHHRNGALLFVDLDDFKTINDTLGHYQGDLLLEQVAQRLSTCIREGDTVARLGGDEFVVMLEDLSEDALVAATQAEAVGEKILFTLNQMYRLGLCEHHSTPSIGITLFGDDPHESIDEPLKRADLAMYQAKAAGRNTLRFFDPTMQAVVTARAALETGLREAIQGDQLLLHYQAQVAGNQQVKGVEALVRWQHPQRGMVSPAEFIPLAEDTGLIVPLGQWVLETACRQLALWAQQPEMAHLTIAVNVSARQFRQHDYIEQVQTVLAHTGANPQRLKLELTESLLVSNVEDVIEKMNVLQEQGVGFSLDDFGTGYSSLSYLKRLPLQQLKIDQSFVRDILIDPNDATIAEMIIGLASSLGLAVIAEGVETEAQKNFLADLGCHAYQGYLFSRPLPIAAFEEFIRIQQT